jgi:ADP-L-glycero-D-manno-heptose 6-epimerase
MFYLVTGGAGFIGSNLIAALEARNDRQIVICDRLRDSAKWRNIAKRCLWDIVHPDHIYEFLDRHVSEVDTIFHMGAISTTTETDADLVLKNNFSLSRALLDWCTANDKRLIYASSAATYGNGEMGFVDREDEEYLSSLRPLNPYGWSKNLFDRGIARRRALNRALPPQLAGLKFFNVFGPNEYHKAGQQSVVSHIYHRLAEGGIQRLFRSDDHRYRDGEQLRDFIYVDDCISVMLWLLDNPGKSGLFNVGTGKARTFLDLNAGVYEALGRVPIVEFMDMPAQLRGRYQYFTQADISKLRAAGYATPFADLRETVRRYVQSYLIQTDSYR